MVLESGAHASEHSGSSARAVLVWDAPTRVVHWAFVLLIATSWWTGENGAMDWHRYSGLTLLAVLVFRIYWGFVGASTARFSSFVRSPAAIAAYAKALFDGTSSGALPGHNPLGAVSVLALLLLMGAQVGLGLFAVDVDGIESGPLSHWVSFDSGRTCAELHEDLFDILFVLILVHIAAVLFYLIVKRRNLIGAMLHGRQTIATNTVVQPASPVRLLIGIVLAAFIAWAAAEGFWT